MGSLRTFKVIIIPRTRFASGVCTFLHAEGGRIKAGETHEVRIPPLSLDDFDNATVSFIHELEILIPSSFG